MAKKRLNILVSEPLFVELDKARQESGLSMGKLFELSWRKLGGFKWP